MSAILTDQFRILRASDFVAGINPATDSYYAFLSTPYTDEIDFVAWNEDKDIATKVIVIVNDEKIHNIFLPTKFHWSSISLGKFYDIHTITILVNSKLKLHVELNDSNRELFKQTNRSTSLACLKIRNLLWELPKHRL